MNIEEFLKENAKMVNEELSNSLKKKASERYIEILLGRAGYKYDTEAIDKSILEPAWYLFEQGGKRWRPALMLLVLEALGKNPKDYVEFALIPEAVHTATVIHDDIEDGSTMRRGVPAVHVKFGLDIANNLGDFMYFFPMRALIDSKKLDAATKNKIMTSYFNNMTRIAVGQATDLAWHRGLVDIEKISEDNYLQMAMGKTGIISRLACEIGGIIGGLDEKKTEALGKFGATIGVAFQIQDDILNIVKSGVSETKGGVGDDITEGKVTLLVIYALKNLNDGNKRRLKEIMQMHTKDKRTIDEAIALIKESGAIDYSKAIEEKLMKEAWNDVDKILPESDAKTLLGTLATFLIARSI